MDEMTAMHWRCYDCNMTFSNPSLLQKHRARFCIGGGLGDPDQLMLRRGFRSEVPPGGGDAPDDAKAAITASIFMLMLEVVVSYVPDIYMYNNVYEDDDEEPKI